MSNAPGYRRPLLGLFPGQPAPTLDVWAVQVLRSRHRDAATYDTFREELSRDRIVAENCENARPSLDKMLDQYLAHWEVASLAQVGKPRERSTSSGRVTEATEWPSD